MSNNWKQPPDGNQPGGQNNKAPHTGNLWSDYGQQAPNQSFNRYSPAPMPARAPYPSSSLPPGPGMQPGSQLPVPRPGQISPHSGLLRNARQMVNRVSGKVAAIKGQAAAPLVRYRPPIQGMPEPLPKAKPWKRSKSVRLAMRMRHRREIMGLASRRVGLIITVALIFFIVISASSGTAYGYAYYQSQQPQLQGIANKQITLITGLLNGISIFL